jgi:hypothetical protein
VWAATGPAPAAGGVAGLLQRAIFDLTVGQRRPAVQSRKRLQSTKPPGLSSRLVSSDRSCVWVSVSFLPVARTGNEVLSSRGHAHSPQRPKNWRHHQRPSGVPGVFRFCVHLCDRTAPTTKNGWDDQDLQHGLLNLGDPQWLPPPWPARPTTYHGPGN